MGPSAHGYRQEQDRLEHLRQRVTRLEMENLELRRQLDELRRGVGISVLIQGRAVPLAPASLGAARPAEAALASRTSHQPVAAVPSRVSYLGTASQPYPSPPAPHPYAAPPASQPPAATFRPSPAPITYPTPLQAASRSGSLQSGPRSEPFSESSWLTGSMPAVQAPPPQQPRSASPSQQMTPSWLREQSALPSQPARGISGGMPEHAGRGWPGEPGQAFAQEQTLQPAPPPMRGTPQPSLPQLETVPLSSLAELTSQHRALRVPRREADRERNHYSDSYLLG